MAKMLLHPSGGIGTDPGTIVLKAGEYAEMVEAENIVARAREEAERIRVRAETEAEDRRRAGYEEGMAEGKLEISAQMFESVAASLDHMARMESSFVDVVMRSVRTILGSFDNADLAEKVVGHALRLVRDEKKVLLRVSMDDVDAVQARLADIVKRYPGMGRVDVAADPSLGAGGCIMETELGVIDATLDRQLGMIEDAFRRHLEERTG